MRRPTSIPRPAHFAFPDRFLFPTEVGQHEAEAGAEGRNRARAAYAAVGAGLWAMPRATGVHHWILATPFQYLAIALAVRALPWRDTGGGKRIAGITLAVLATLWLGLRLAALGSLENALRHGNASEASDPSLAELGRFAAGRPPGTLFVATDWGVATQILCFVNGRPGRVVEPFWDERGLGAPEIAAAIDGARTLYLVRPRRATGLFPATARMEHEIANDPSWRGVLPEPETSGWRAVSLRKYVRAAPEERHSPQIPAQSSVHWRDERANPGTGLLQHRVRRTPSAPRYRPARIPPAPMAAVIR